MVRKFQLFCTCVVLVQLLGIGAVYFLPRRANLVEAVRQVESGGVETKVGDRKLKHKAYTSLQIRQPALDDVNKFFAKEIKEKFGRDKFSFAYLKQNREALDWCFEKYTGRYATRQRLGREPTDEDRARIWNGGPNGWKEAHEVSGTKAKRKALQTKKYARKVLAAL